MFMKPHLLPPFMLRFGTIPTSYKLAMTYEEQILWLCKHIEDLGEAFQVLEENLQSAFDAKQDKLEAGENIFLNNNVINAFLSQDLSYEIIPDYYIDLSGDVGSIVDLTPIPSSNVGYMIIDIKPQESYIIYGKFTLANLDKDTNEITSKFSLNPATDNKPFEIFEALYERKVVISWDTTNEYEPYIFKNLTADYILANLGGGGGGSTTIIAGEGISVDTVGDSSTISINETETPPQEQFQKLLVTSAGKHYDMDNVAIGDEFQMDIITEANTRKYDKFNLKKGDAYLLCGKFKALLTDDSQIILAIFDNTQVNPLEPDNPLENPYKPMYINTWEYGDNTQLYVSWYDTDQYAYASYKLLSFGDLDRLEQQIIESQIPTITENCYVIDLDEGLYKVDRGVSITYIDDSTITFDYTIANKTGYLYVGRVNDYTNFMILDKTSTVGFNGSYDLSSALYCGWSKRTGETTIMGSFNEKLSLTIEYENKTEKVVSGTLSASDTYVTYPSSKVVWDTIQAEIGTITTTLQNINTGNGV